MQRVGTRKFEHILPSMAEQCGLDGQRMTNHSVRKLMLQKLRDCNGHAPTIPINI
ncbi:hypothetical protein DPMN_140448 [Dreissena polymorpha]|uniref:Uncharacterized protein n=1 Tax=Dreissena polymorpha TaxID=45954 RepID=A0A9D4GDJ0_DREPO|nr:hypothetical protein DPMN_140448 [Dreissena polymorpha]